MKIKNPNAKELENNISLFTDGLNKTLQWLLSLPKDKDLWVVTGDTPCGFPDTGLVFPVYVGSPHGIDDDGEIIIDVIATNRPGDLDRSDGDYLIKARPGYKVESIKPELLATFVSLEWKSKKFSEIFKEL